MWLQAGVRVRILGNLSYLPADLRATVREVERVTADNAESQLNIALSYTAREEITQVQYSTVQYSTVQYSTVQYSTVQ